MEDLREELKKKYGYEEVMVCHGEDIDNWLGEDFTPFSQATINNMLNNAFFVRRYDAEKNPIFRQVIPYVVLKHGNTLYAGQRLSGSGEARLVGEMTIGHGGHINRVDAFFGNTISNNMSRELSEEFDIYCNAKLNAKYVGFLNAHGDAVSQDHVAVIILVDMSKPTVEVKEKDKLVGRFIDIEELKHTYREQMGLWSKLTIDVLYERLRA